MLGLLLRVKFGILKLFYDPKSCRQGELSAADSKETNEVVDIILGGHFADGGS